MKVGELRELLAPYKKDQEVVFAKMCEGEDCDVFSYVGSPIFRDDLDDDDGLVENDGIVDLPFNAIIFDIGY